MDMPDLGKRFNMMMNGVPNRRYVDLVGWRCVGTDWDGNCDLDEVPDGEVEDTERLWSRASSWENLPGRIPIDGDDIVIEPSWNMIYDLPADGPIPNLTSLEINGQLTFRDGADRLLKSHSIFVRSGTLQIGNQTHPFVNKATITLLGDNTDHYWAFTNSIEAGNKNLVITGTANIYGTPVLHPRSRLIQTAHPTDS